jgi:hypothetical protein
VDINTVSGETLDDFFKCVPGVLKEHLVRKLIFLGHNGRDCIGAFVFPCGDNYSFKIESMYASVSAEVSISFIDEKNMILVLGVTVIEG